MGSGIAGGRGSTARRARAGAKSDELLQRTTLDILLRNLGVTTVIVAGVWTNMAVEHTVRDAADHGYRTILATDATSSLSSDWQTAALNYALTNIAGSQCRAVATKWCKPTGRPAIS